MPLFGTSDDTNKALGSLQTGYSTASGDLSPYTTYADEDFGTARNKLYGEGEDLSQFGNLADQFYGYAEESPDQMYNSLISNFRMSPAQMSQMRFSMGALNNKMSAEGMGGSGDDLALHAQVANQLMGSDRQQYLKNIAGIFGVDQKILDDFSRQWNSLNKDFGKIMNMEYGSERQLSQIAERLSMEGSRDYMRANSEKNKGMGMFQTGLGDVMGLAKDAGIAAMFM